MCKFTILSDRDGGIGAQVFREQGHEGKVDATAITKPRQDQQNDYNDERFVKYPSRICGL